MFFFLEQLSPISSVISRTTLSASALDPVVVFVGLLTVGADACLMTYLPAPGTLFLLLGCLAQLQLGEGILPCLVFCCVMFGCCPLEFCSFLKGDRGEVGMGEKGNGRSGGRGNCS